jgi:hypothetical protein
VFDDDRALDEVDPDPDEHRRKIGTSANHSRCSRFSGRNKV